MGPETDSIRIIVRILPIGYDGSVLTERTTHPLASRPRIAKEAERITTYSVNYWNAYDVRGPVVSLWSMPHVLTKKVTLQSKVCYVLLLYPK